MNNKKLILALVAFLAVVAVMAGVFLATRPRAAAPTGTTDPSSTSGTGTVYAKTISVLVVHGNGEEKTFTYQTNEEYLGAVLYAEGLIVADAANSGMFDTVDGELASWAESQSYWALYIGEAYATTGVDTTPIQNGDTFKLVYTTGF